ncbi:hypothetical protein BKI52_15850 [marine bacterium AO1-C]|nr:hypothetical protein BKI52_15850 [marine bacterium AO1-C]
MKHQKKLPVIFTAFANPKDDLGNLILEQNGIQDVFSRLCAEGIIQAHLVRTSTDLNAYFRFLITWQNQISIFHFGGHANSQKLEFQDVPSFFAPLAKELVQRNKESLKLVFLNGCTTRAHVQTLFDLGLGAVIATTNSIPDRLASSFAIHFYENLAQGDQLKQAYESAYNLAHAKSQSSRSLILRWSESNEELSNGSADDVPWKLYYKDPSNLAYSLTAVAPKSTLASNAPNDALAKARRDIQNIVDHHQQAQLAADQEKQYLLFLVKNNLEKTLELLSTRVQKNASDPKLLNWVILQQSIYQDLEHQRLMGIINAVRYQEQINELKTSILAMIHQL